MCGLFSVKDQLMNFNGAIAIQDEKVALRWFETFCKNKKANNEDPKYYDFYKIGEFNEETGVVKGYSKQNLVLLQEGVNFE